MSHGVPRFVGGEKTMTTRDAHVRSPRLSPVSFAVDAPLRSVGFPTFRLTPPQFSRPFAIPSLRSLQIFSPRPRRGTAANRCAPRFVGGEKTMTTRDAHVRSPRLSPVSFAVDAPLRSVGFPTFRLTPPQFSRPFAIPSLRSLQIFSPRPERRGLNSSATLSYEIIAHSFRRSAYMPDRNNANPPQSNSFRRFCVGVRIKLCEF